MPARPESEQLAASLRALKNRAGLSYEALAKRTDIAGSTLHRYRTLAQYSILQGGGEGHPEAGGP
ncbi:helix-turn-helix domain-containing protein [Streptomyces sp. ME02-8801-2C]|uniref:helix-turn-helix domain-containing protein n=1 Tax=Streptomyces sp. ME02-8801-2C TaxID=3028680 RepID=UPI0039F68E31